MKILQVTPYFPPHLGGVEYHVKGLADGLRCRGYDVEVASSCGNCKMKFIRVPSINFMYFPVPLKFPKTVANIYHSHVPSPTFAFHLREAHPHVVTYHNDVIVPSRINGFGFPGILQTSLERINKKIVEPVLDKAEIIIATTKSYAETSKILHRYLHKVRIVPNAIDASLYHPSKSREPYVVYVGRLLDYKGVDVLIEAMEMVQKETDLKLILIGDGYDRKKLEERARRLGVDAFFTGRVEYNRLIDMISRAEMLVLPAQIRLEAFGIVLLEAMACETPVLAFDIPGVSEVAKDGGLVFSDRSELCQLILELHVNEPLRAALGRRGRKAVLEKYSWNRVLDQIESIYEEIT
jgi:glycosyltransferase involved in cell wall biosynthesis